MTILNELQQDALTEAINQGIGIAAASLSEMVNEEILLSVPEISFITKADAIAMLHDKTSEHVSGVSQNFSGPFNGQALLLFPVTKSLELVRLMLQDTVPMEQLTEFEEEALNEIGNIILNAGLGSLADMLGNEITSSLPVFRQGSCDRIMGDDSDNKNEIVLFLRVAFNIESHKVDGYVIYLLDVRSIDDLVIHIDRFLEQIG